MPLPEKTSLPLSCCFSFCGAPVSCLKPCTEPGQTLAGRGQGLALMDVVTDGSRDGSTNRPIPGSTGGRERDPLPPRSPRATTASPGPAGKLKVCSDYFTMPRDPREAGARKHAGLVATVSTRGPSLLLARHFSYSCRGRRRQKHRL